MMRRTEDVDSPPAHEEGGEPSDEPSGRPARGLRSLPVLPLAAVALAVISVAGAYLVSHKGKGASHSAAALASTPAPASISPLPVLVGALPAEASPDGMPWQWIGASTSVQLAGGSTRSWLAFRALSPGGPRVLRFSGPAGEAVTATLSGAARVYLAGPLSNGRILVRASRLAKPRLPASSPVSVSALRAAAVPVAALPGAGFWPTETAGVVVFNWMRGSGVIDVYAPGAPAGRVRLAFDVRSLEQSRSLTVRSGHEVERLGVTTTARPVGVGPFQLVAGRARLILQASPGPRRYPGDPRALSIQVADLSASTSSPKP